MLVIGQSDNFMLQSLTKLTASKAKKSPVESPTSMWPLS